VKTGNSNRTTDAGVTGTIGTTQPAETGRFVWELAGASANLNYGRPIRAAGFRVMMCPFCRHDETKVIDSRASQQFAIRRRRECLKCGRRFTTYEKIEASPLKVIKKDGSRVPFDREKIRAGLEKSCYKRPVSDDDIEAVICDVEADIYQDFEREVPSRVIGEQVFNALRQIDQVAFVRFASVYREFKDVNDFVDELEPMLRRQRPRR